MNDLAGSHQILTVFPQNSTQLSYFSFRFIKKKKLPILCTANNSLLLLSTTVAATLFTANFVSTEAKQLLQENFPHQFIALTIKKQFPLVQAKVLVLIMIEEIMPPVCFIPSFLQACHFVHQNMGILW